MIVDDLAVPSCALAVEDHRAAHGIDAPIGEVDGTGAWWRKPLQARWSRPVDLTDRAGRGR